MENPEPSLNQILTRFGGNEAAINRYMQIFMNKDVLVEREVILLYLERYGIKEIFERNGWESLAGPYELAVVELVREFYSQIPYIVDISSCQQFHLTLRGIPFTFSESLIAHTLRLPQIPDSSYPYITI